MSPHRIAWLCAVLSVNLPAIQAQSASIRVTTGVYFEPGLPNVGGIASVFAAGLAVNGVITASGAPLPRSLAGITVDVCGSLAPIYSVANLGSYQQVNFQVPWEAHFTYNVEINARQCDVTVSQGAFFRATETNVYVRDTKAADLYVTSDYIGVMQHGRPDLARVTRADPARPGETLVLYAAALPQTDPPVATGAAAPYSPLAIVEQYATTSNTREVALYLDDTERLTPAFVGLSPGSVGLYQINFTVPTGTTNGDHILKLGISECHQFWGGGCSGHSGYGGYSNLVILPVHRP